MRRLFIFLFASVLFSCGGDETGADGLQAMNGDSLLRNIATLASDSFMGRKPFTPGEKKTLVFLENAFRDAGLEPGNGDSFFQDVPMVSIRAKADPTMHVTAGSREWFMQALREYVIWTNSTDDHVSLASTPVVFAGYGVVAPEYGWNDYEGIDVKGKVVIVMVNDPGFWSGDSTLFRGKAMTYYGRWTYKFEEAARQGARGCLVIHRTSAAGYPFSVVQNSFNTSRLQLDDRGKPQNPTDVLGWITDTAALSLFSAAGLDSTLFARADRKGFKAVPLDVRLSTNMTVKTVYNRSANVLGRIRGSKRPDEVIIYTAHWDHLGIHLPDESGDSIYNGALDNASGTAGLIELARAFKKTKPERTVLLMAVTAEEQGLLGSLYYTRHPVYPVEKTVAEINIDMLNNFGITKDIQIVGYGQSDLEDDMRGIVEKEGGYVVPEGSPETGGYFRSDHFNFAKAGIPALYQGSGVDIAGKGKEYGIRLKAEYTSKNYHRPSDELDMSKWNAGASLHELKLYYLIGKKLAFETRWPQWKEGSEFKAVRDKQASGR